MQYHEIANIFPLMNDAEFEELKRDIQTNGQIEPIWIHDGKIIDGRNRYRACEQLGITPAFKTWSGSGSLVSFVVSLNLHRRHLTSSQRAVISLEVLPMLEEEAMERHRKLAGRAPLNGGNNSTVSDTGRSREQAAELFSTNSRYVSDAKKLQEEAPELLEKVRAGEMTIPEAKKDIKKQKRDEEIQQQQQEIETNLFIPSDRLYDVIVIDPPWPYGTKYDPSGRRAANPYPEMTLEEIENISLPCSDNCVLWIWTTHKFMRHTFKIIDAWGFRDVAILTWVKDRMGLGSWLRSQSEFCIMAVKGKPLINLTNQTTIITGPLREHSRKPDEFYEMVDSLCVGYKIDWFSREARDGWSQFGNDPERFK